MTDSFSDATDPANIIVPGSVQNGPFGPTTYNLGNGLTAVNTYDTLGRSSGGWVCAGSSQPTCTGGTLQAYGYTVYTVGTQVKQTCDIVVNVCNSFGYDEFNRLTARTVNQGTVQNFTYTYDRYGNRWAQNAPQGGPTLSISFNQANNIINSSGFANDVPGNIANDSLHGYSYDADGNLISVDNGATARYYYDSLNQRVQIAPTRGTFEFVWDIFGRRVSTWFASSHNLIESNAYTDSAPIAIRGGGSTQFEHQNWLGTERVRTNYNGTVAISINSLPWADGHTPSGDNGDQHDFALMERDLEDNTEHAQFRQYSTNLGRWQSPDLYLGSYDFANPQSFNRYTYALNNPSSFVDPSGLDCSDNNGTDLGDAGGTGIEVGGGCNPTPNPPPSQPGNWCGGVAWGTEGCIQPPCGYPGAACSGPGGTPGGTPPTGPPRLALLSAPSKTCTAQALFSGAGSIAIDSIGLIPEAEGILKVFENTAGYQLARAAGNTAGYRGVVATQYGMKAVAQGKGGTALIAGAFGLGDTSVQGRISTGLTVAGFVPGLGTLAAGASIANDAIKAGMAVAKCP
jgi:RHS repeat-associated protein